MKIAIIGSRGYPYVYSGYETFVKEFSERIVKQNARVTVYCHAGLFENKPKQKDGIDLVYIPTIESKFLSQLIHSFLSFIHACYKKPDIILVVNVANGPLGIIPRIFGIPILINVDGLEWLRPKWKGLGSLYFKFSAKMATILYNKIITDSDEMSKVYRTLFNVDSSVIAYGSPKAKIIKRNLIKQFDINEKEYFLIVGRLIPDNNSDILIRGFLESNSKKKLVIVGDVPYNDRYSKQIKKIKDPRIVMTGYVRDSTLLYQLYKNCYAYVHGHEYGGTNPTMIKALGYGTAILALDTPFNREMLQGNKFGLLFKKSVNSIRDLIEFSEKNLEIILSLRQNSFKGISKKYDWDHIVSQYLVEFKSLHKN